MFIVIPIDYIQSIKHTRNSLDTNYINDAIKKSTTINSVLTNPV